MRRLFSPVLIGLGTFLIAIGVLVKFYAYPQLAEVPANYKSETNLEAAGATIFNTDPEVLAPETVDLRIASLTRAGKYDDAPDDVVVWANTTTVTPEGWDDPFNQSTELAPFDATSGAAVSYKESFYEVKEGDEPAERVDVTREGQVYKFPFDTQKKDYLQWDDEIGEATTAEYQGEEEIQGLTVYKFVQTIEPTVVDTREVPGSVFELDALTVEADVVYEMTRTLYIEPNTGAPVNRVEERNQVLSYEGTEVPAFVGTVEYTDAEIDEVVDKVSTRAWLLGATHVLLPVGLGLLGLACIGAGLLLRRRVESDAPDEHRKELVNA
jgi:hypothetical protein